MPGPLPNQPHTVPLTGPLAKADLPWLATLGAHCPPDKDEASWLGELNALVGAGSVFDLNKKTEAIAARNRFFDLLTVIPEPKRRLFDARVPNSMPPVTFIETQRTLYNLGLDGARMLRILTDTATHSAEEVELCVATLNAHGLDPRRVLRMNPSVMCYAPESLTERIEHMTALGLDPVRVVTVQPRLLSPAPAVLTRRVHLMAARGLDVPTMVYRNPNLLAVAEQTMRERLILFQSTARAWGIRWSDIVAVMEKFPALLGYKTDRTRTVIRVMSRTIQARPTLPPTASEVSTIMTQPVEALLAAYLRHRTEISTRLELYRYARRYAWRDKTLLRAILEDNHEEPVLKFYWRAYPHAPGARLQPAPEPTRHNTPTTRPAR